MWRFSLVAALRKDHGAPPSESNRGGQSLTIAERGHSSNCQLPARNRRDQCRFVAGQEALSRFEIIAISCQPNGLAQRPEARKSRENSLPEDSRVYPVRLARDSRLGALRSMADGSKKEHTQLSHQLILQWPSSDVQAGNIHETRDPWVLPRWLPRGFPRSIAVRCEASAGGRAHYADPDTDEFGRQPSA
jgi:hypothetical protein